MLISFSEILVTRDVGWLYASALQCKCKPTLGLDKCEQDKKASLYLNILLYFRLDSSGWGLQVLF